MGSDDSGLTGRVAFVTGGGSGIGEACARLLAERGAAVVVADLDPAAADRVASGLVAGSAVGIDVTDPGSVDAAVAGAMDRYGRLDIAVNSAGIGVPHPRPVGELPFAEWRRVLDVDLDGVFHSLHAEVPAMLASGGGSIVNVASILGAVGEAGASAYVAAKHAVVGLTKSAALEYAERGIRVNAVGPAFVSTPMFTRRTPEEQATVAARHPIGRVATPGEVAAFVGFLAGPDASFCTGTYYPIDGGFLAR